MNAYTYDLLSLPPNRIETALELILFGKLNHRFYSEINIPIPGNASIQVWWDYVSLLVCFLATMNQEDMDEFIASFQ